MVCYSADGKSGYLTRQGIGSIKAGLAKQIFRQELYEIYERQTQRRDSLTRQARLALGELIEQMENGPLENPKIEMLMDHLAVKLKTVSGKKQYGYLKAPLKSLVDEIVDELAKDPRVAQAYNLWYQMREEVLRTYKDDLPERLPLSRQKEFKQIRNLVIQEAVRLGEFRQVFSPVDPQDEVMEEADASAKDAGTPHTKNTESKSASKDGGQHTRLARDPKHNARSAPLAESVTRLLHHMANIFREQEPPAPAGSIRFTDKKLRRKIQEKKIAMGHKPDDHEPTITM